jgi:hypothetical protein
MKHLVKTKTRRCIIIAIFQLCFGICHQVYPGKPGGTKIKRNTSSSVFSDDVNLLGDIIDTIKKKKNKL